MVNIKEIRKDPGKDPRLKPGDTIEVPQSFCKRAMCGVALAS